MKFVILAGAALALACGVQGPALAADPVASPAALAAANEVVAQRGDQKLTIGDVREAVQNAEPALRAKLLANPAAMSEFVRDRLLKETLLAQAKAAGVDKKPDVVLRANEARDAVIVAAYVGSLTQLDPAYPSQAEIASVYEASKARFMLPRQYQVAQIAIRVPPGATKEVEAEAVARIRALRLQLTKPKADFAEIAKTASQDRASGEHGGELGWLREDLLVGPVKEAVAAMSVGAVSDPIRTPDGWHILKLLGTRAAGPATLAEAQDSVVQALRQQRAQQLARGVLDEMLRKEPIQLNEIALARSVRSTP